MNNMHSEDLVLGPIMNDPLRTREHPELSMYSSVDFNVCLNLSYMHILYYD